MSTKSELGRGALSRRSFLKTSAGVALAGATGSLALSKLAAAQDGGLVALIHTQAAGDNSGTSAGRGGTIVWPSALAQA